MKQSLQLKLSQQLRLTPQLQQAIRLLQLSSLELEKEIQTILDENPLLERSETNDDEDDDLFASTDTIAEADQYNLEDTSGNWEQDIPETLVVDSNWDDIYDSQISHGPSDDGFFEVGQHIANQASSSLQEHLSWQLNLLPLSKIDQIIGLAIIDSIDTNGYLQTDLSEMAENIANELDVSLSEVGVILNQIQQLDPPGVGARNLQECLQLQLVHFDITTPGLKSAIKIVDSYLEVFAKQDFDVLLSSLKITKEELNLAIQIIRHLTPNPGAIYSDNTSDYQSPDIIVKKEQQQWLVELNPEATPKIRLNQTYLSFLDGNVSKQERTYLKSQAQEARWLIRSLKSRYETLLQVAKSIIGKQIDFLEQGEEAMQPLVMQQIADELNMHESTISRATTNKYLLTPRGLYELKFFFSSQLINAEGLSCSSTAIRALIKKLVSNEAPSKPLSDDKIVKLLEEKGINVARRTVAKYREMLNIPKSTIRKRFNPQNL